MSSSHFGVALVFMIFAPTTPLHSLPPTQTSSSEAENQGEAPIAFPALNAQRFTLPNGLVIIVQRDTSAPVASIQAWCKTGSIHEGEQMGAGLSHILEHMLFKGTTTRGANEIARSIQDQGGYINAYTSFDRTVYWVDIPKEGVETALEILSDAMLNSTLPEEEYAKEQEVIRREFAMGFDDPGRTLGKLLFSTAFQQHPMRHPVIGYLEVYNQLTREQVVDYYQRRYVPNNLFFVVVGDIRPEAVVEKLSALFSDRPRQALAPVFVPEEPLQLGRRELHETFPTELSRIYLAWHIPGITHPDLPTLDILAAILGQGRSSRLYTELRDRRQLAFEASAHAYTPSGPGLFIISGVTTPAQREAFTQATLELVAQAASEGVSEQELARAKRMLLADQLGELTTMRGKASSLGSNWLLTGNLDFTREYLQQLQKVSVEDLKRIAAHYFRDDTLSIVSLNPEETKANLEPSQEAPADRSVQMFQLSNGLRLLVREDPRLPLVTLNALFRSGVLAESADQNGISTLLAALLPKGTTSRSAEELSLLIEEAGGSLDVTSGNNSLSVSLDLLAPDLELGLEILADLLLNATLPDEALKREKEAQLAAIKDQNDDPLFVARQGFARAMFGEHPYSRQATGSPETVSSLTREQLLAFRDQHLTAKNGVLAVFGAVKAEEVRRLVEDRLSALRRGDLAFEQPPQPIWPQQVQRVRNELPKNQAILVIGYPGRALSDEENIALDLIAAASSSLGSRFFDRIREQLGLAYFVGAVNHTGVTPGSFFFYLGTDPVKLDKVLSEFEDEIAKLRDHGLTAEELDRAKNKQVAAVKLGRQRNSTFAHETALNELLGLGYLWDDHLIKAVTNISLDEVNAVAKRVLSNPAKVVSIVEPPPNRNASSAATPITP